MSLAPPTLDAAELIAAARAEAGFADLDDDSLPARLADLVAQLASRLDDDGQRARRSRHPRPARRAPARARDPLPASDRRRARSNARSSRSARPARARRCCRCCSACDPDRAAARVLGGDAAVAAARRSPIRPSDDGSATTTGARSSTRSRSGWCRIRTTACSAATRPSASGCGRSTSGRCRRRAWWRVPAAQLAAVPAAARRRPPVRDPPHDAPAPAVRRAVASVGAEGHQPPAPAARRCSTRTPTRSSCGSTVTRSRPSRRASSS